MHINSICKIWSKKVIRSEKSHFMYVLQYVFTFVILCNIKYFLRRVHIFLRSFFMYEIRQNLQNVKIRCIDVKIERG